MKYAAPLFLAILTTALSTSGTHAEIYKSVDKDGKITFSDKPVGAEKVEELDLPPINSQSPAEAAPPINTSPEDDGTAVEYSLSIVSPASGSQIPMGQSRVSVSVSVSPGLHADHQLQAMLNGAPFGEPASGTLLVLEYLHRGENQLSVAVIDTEGNTLAESSPITLFVQRPIFKPQATPKAGK
ncbi:DUF4124 domain-containing protein [Pseudomaricurvus sp. HS19]|uniref:DUF4124 domain-containing protein n=1 Tax=Pseudomaricurvus sp. HS19 TaxID=2692626 RepID=UPI00136BDCD2|nr:DUF4124 domain-containing protein [Pseudomaricurvus sp. HS19]MYM64121.1 DUF4124 domain-containing protein [Pseudomaricurvus sp. HS19]